MKTYWILNYRGHDVQMSAETTRSNLGPDKWDELQAAGHVNFCGYVFEAR